MTLARMLADNIKYFFLLYVRPLSAVGGIIDHGSWVIGALVVIAVSVAWQVGVARVVYSGLEAAPVTIEYPRTPGRQHAALREVALRQDDFEDFERDPVVMIRRPLPLPFVGYWLWRVISFSTFSTLLTVVSLAVLYVPVTLLVVVMLARVGSFGVAFRRDYGPLLASTFMAWAASHLPFAAIGFLIAPIAGDPYVYLGLWLLATLHFAFLMVCAVRVIFGVSYTVAVATISVSWLSWLLESLLLLLASPFILLWLYLLLRGEVGTVGASYSRRQSFRRSLEAATVNPRDAEAHYQLGLIYQQRRQYAEAIERFEKAVEIDPRELDAHFQLGKIARAQGRLQDAINHFNAVVAEDDKHSQSEIWREIGATYKDAGMYDDALAALETYLERREYDPQGLVYYGEVLTAIGREDAAAGAFERAIEAARTTPDFRRGEARRWGKQAEERLRALQGDR